jgi:hypothetical protein
LVNEQFARIACSIVCSEGHAEVFKLELAAQRPILIERRAIIALSWSSA